MNACAHSLLLILVAIFGSTGVQAQLLNDAKKPLIIGTVSVDAFGAIGNGANNLLSERYSTLTEARAQFPFLTSLNQTIDWAAAQAATNYASKIGAATVKFNGKGPYRISDTIDCSSDHHTTLAYEGDLHGTYIQQVALDGRARTLFSCRGERFKHNALFFKNIYLNQPEGFGATAEGNVAFDIVNRQETVWGNVTIVGYREGIKLTRSYAPLVTGKSFFWTIHGRAIYATDASWKGARVQTSVFYGNGKKLLQPALSIGPGEGIYITGNDFASNYIAVSFSDASGVAMHGNYMEDSVRGLLEFESPRSSAISILGNTFQIGSPTVFKHVDGMTFANNVIYNWSISYDVTATRVFQYGNSLKGTSILADPFCSSGSSPFSCIK